jgi:hypothetical protein
MYGGSYSPPSYTRFLQAAQQAYQNAAAETNSQESPTTSQLRTYGEKKYGEKTPVNVLDTLGVPNDGSRLSWPVGLQILPPAAETSAMRQQIDALALEVATQAANKELNAGTLQETIREVNKLQGLLFENGSRIPALTSFQQADQFLTRLKDGLSGLRSASAGVTPGKPAAPTGSAPYSPLSH